MEVLTGGKSPRAYAKSDADLVIRIPEPTVKVRMKKDGSFQKNQPGVCIMLYILRAILLIERSSEVSGYTGGKNGTGKKITDNNPTS